jgi:hypothetical protein
LKDVQAAHAIAAEAAGMIMKGGATCFGILTLRDIVFALDAGHGQA